MSRPTPPDPDSDDLPTLIEPAPRGGPSRIASLDDLPTEIDSTPDRQRLPAAPAPPVPDDT